MNNRRRRANDFTDSLTSFRQTFIEDQTLSLAYSEDSLDIGSTKGRQHDNQQKYAKNKSHTGSIILAGHLASEHNISLPESLENAHKDRRALSKDIINVSDETSYMSLKPDLNKCINLFQNECPSKESCTAEELSSSALEIRVNRNSNTLHFSENKNVEVQCNLSRNCPRSVSQSSLRIISSPFNEIRRSKSCVTVNDNLKMDINSGVKAELRSSASRDAAMNMNTKIRIVISPCKTLLVSKSSTTSTNKKTNSHSTKEDQKRDSVSSERSSEEECNPSELRAVLNSLKDQKPWKEEGMVQKCLRRMSANFYDSPRNFTEQLLTIIEESVINNDTSGALEYPEISLCRLTEELRKMCKFIEDETVPEWPRSPNIDTSTRNGRKYSRDCHESQLDSSRKSLDAVATPNKNLCVTPTPTRRIKSPKKICRPKISAQSPKPHDSTSTFESLEAFCKILYPDEDTSPPEKIWSQSPLRDMKRILLACGNQMASLDSPNIYEQLKKAATSTVDPARKPDVVPETQAPQCNLLSHEKRDEAGSKSISDVLRSKQQAESSKRYEMINPDHLEDTLMYEIAKKRQRCLDTAKVMKEIDASSEPVSSGAAEAQQSDPSSAAVELPNINDSKFMETLMTVKKYQDYLEGAKPLLNLFEQSRSNTSRFSRGEKVVKKTSKAHLGLPKSPMMRKKSPSARLGSPKSPMTRKKSPSARLGSPKSPMTRKKSPSARRYSLNNVVISKPKLFITPGKTPVKRTCTNTKRTYFPNLIAGASKQRRDISPHEKNVYRQIGSYDHVISPVAMYIRSTNPCLVKNVRPKTNEMLLTPRKQQITSSGSPKPRMKLRLSPKEPKEETAGTAAKDENVADNFLHPKVHYELPTHVRTIKEMEGRKVGSRINELLRTTQDKVVIRHEGRAKSMKTDCSEQPEIHYTSAEESVHVEQTARKTQFSRI
ncbi:hypothetical protein DMN91_012085 [Ooceraea biroi]|uniref:Uncharacterized protein n=1 Tax=Ooceraea biroi TaxID=2015173 RepID=A0A3L8D775_OOCBI|nr:uncharacterized protein LOC105280529 [Ooceraea biroi]RLU16325.1 hypothetical protein DMN91_012085 [Ooceraea biroi]